MQDQNGRPIEGAKITPLMINRVGNSGSDDSFNLNPELIESYRTTTVKKGLAGIPIQCFRLNETWYIKDQREAETDAHGQYSLAILPGPVKLLPAALPQTGLVARSSEAPEIELTADQGWPDLKLVQAMEVDGIVLDEKGQPVVGADVHMLDGGPVRQDEVTDQQERLVRVPRFVAGVRIRAEILACGYTRGNLFTIKGKSGETYNAGKFALQNTVKRLGGRVVGSDGRPVSDAVVFSRGASREVEVATTDSEGRFHLPSLAPETKHLFIHKDGYRFTGAHLLTTPTRFPPRSRRRVNHRRRGSPPAAASFDQERAFAKRILIRFWENTARMPTRMIGMSTSWRWRRSICRWLWSGRRSAAASTTVASASPLRRQWPRPTFRERWLTWRMIATVIRSHPF